MVIPKPQSTRQLVRRTHATCIDEIGRLYSAIVSGWILEETESPHCRKNLKEEGKEIDSDRFGSDKHERAEQASVHLSSPFSLAVQKAARGRMLALWTKLNGTRARIIQSTYEPSSRGDWPREEYTRLLDTQLQLAQALAQLGSSLTRLGPRWRRILVRRTAFLNPNLVSAQVLTWLRVYELKTLSSTSIHDRSQTSARRSFSCRWHCAMPILCRKRLLGRSSIACCTTIVTCAVSPNQIQPRIPRPATRHQ